MTGEPRYPTGSNQINQDTGGDSNQTIGQVYGGIVVYVSGGQAIFNPPGTTATPLQQTSASADENPYKGLAAFHESDRDRFFGRSQEINQLWRDFRELHEMPGATRLLPIYGPSGSGKSSLVRAGFISELARHPLPGRERARVAVIKPGSHPIQALATVLARIAENDLTPARKSREFAEELSRPNRNQEFDGLQRVASVLPDIATFPLIVLIDQFEEVYSLCDVSQESARGERDQFVATLLDAAKDRSQYVSVIITFRSDFLGETHQHPVLNRLFSKQGFLVPTMDEASLEEAIAQPAKAVGYPLDSATINLLIQQTLGREGALPLLQFALTRIWENLSHQEPAQTLREIGGVGGALADEADRIYGRLSPVEKDIAQRIFLGLIQLGEGTRDTRRRVEFNTLVSVTENPKQVQTVLQQFANPGVRLLMLSSAKDPVNGTELTTVEVTHEALLEHWQRLKSWLDKGRDDLRFQRRLENAAKYWEEQKKDNGLVWRSPNLELLESFYQRTNGSSTALKLTPLQLEFYQASKLQMRRQKFMKSGLFVLSFLFVGVVGFSLQSLRLLEYQKSVTEAVFLQANNQEVADSLSELEIFADQLQKEIDTLPDTISSEAVLSHYHRHEDEFKKLFAYYRNILTVTGRLNREVDQDETERTQRIEGVLGKLLNKYRLPQLQLDLASNHHSKFLEEPVTAFEEQYSEGAARTTYEILMTNSGAGADLNKDGFVADTQEAQQLPCITLQKIEELWRSATSDMCGWYSPDGPYAYDSDCTKLDDDRSTLYTTIFGYSTSHAFERIQVCMIAPQ